MLLWLDFRDATTFLYASERKIRWKKEMFLRHCDFLNDLSVNIKAHSTL